MWSKMHTLVVAFSVLCLLGSRAGAAPLPDLGAANVSGTVIEAKWSPQELVKAKPGMSGSLGRDRVFPAHFLVRLKDYEGVDAVKARAMNAFLGQAEEQPKQQPPRKPAVLLLQLDSENQKLLRPGMKIKVRAYAIRGDEGGTWTKYEKLEVRSVPKKDEKQPAP